MWPRRHVFIIEFCIYFLFAKSDTVSKTEESGADQSDRQDQYHDGEVNQNAPDPTEYDSYGRSDGDGNPRALSGYRRGETGLNNDDPRNEPNDPDINYSESDPNENYQGLPNNPSPQNKTEAFYPRSHNPEHFNSGQGNYNLIETHQSDREPLAQQKTRLERITPKNYNTQQNTGISYQLQQSNNLIKRSNFGLKPSNSGHHTTPNEKSSTLDTLTLFEQKMAEVEKQRQKMELDEFLLTNASGNVTYFKNIPKKVEYKNGKINGVPITVDQILKEVGVKPISINMNQHWNSPVTKDNHHIPNDSTIVRQTTNGAANILSSGYAQHPQVQKSFYTALRQQPVQSYNQIPFQNQHPNLHDQNPNSFHQNQYLFQHNPSNQHPYFVPQNQYRYQGNQNFYSQIQHQDPNQGFNPRNLYHHPGNVRNDNSYNQQQTKFIADLDPSKVERQNHNPVPQNSVPHNTAPQNPDLQNSALQNSVSQNSVPQNPVFQNSNLQNQVPQNSVPQNPVPQNPVPQNPVPKNPDPENPLPQNLVPQNPVPQNSVPQNPVPQNPVPQNLVPQNIVPQNPDPQNPVLQQSVPQNPDPKEPIPQNSNLQNPEPQNPVPQNPTPQNPVLQNSNAQNQVLQKPVPKNPVPQNPVPKNPVPQNPIPQNLVPQNPDPQNPVPQHLVPQNPDPKKPIPQDSNLQNPEPQNPVPQNSTLQNPVPQNPSPQNPVPQNPDPQKADIKPSSVQPTPTEYIDYDAIEGWYDQIRPATTPTEKLETETLVPEIQSIIPEELPQTENAPWMIQDAKKAMVENRMGYFNGFLYELFTIITNKEDTETQELFIGLLDAFEKMVKSGRFPELGNAAPSLESGLKEAAIFVMGDNISQLAEMGISMVKEKKYLTRVLYITNILDSAYTIEEGDKLLKNLEDVDAFTSGGGKTAEEIGENIATALYKPFTTLPTRDKAKLIQLITETFENRLPYDMSLRQGNNKSKDDRNNTLYSKLIHLNNRDEHHDRDKKNSYGESMSKTRQRVDNIKRVRSKENEKHGFKQRNIQNKETASLLPRIYKNTFTKQRIKTNLIKDKNRSKLIDNQLSKNLVNNKSKQKHSRSKHKRNEINKAIHILKMKADNFDKLAQNEYNYENSLRNKYNSRDFNTREGDEVVFDDTYKTHNKVKYNFDPKTTKNTKLNGNIESDDDSFDRDMRNTNIESKEINYRKSQIDIKRTRKDKTEHSVPIDGRRNVKNTKYKSNKNVNGNLKEKNIMEESSYYDEEDLFKVMLSDAFRHSDFVFNNYRRTDDKVKVEGKMNDVSSYSDEENSGNKHLSIYLPVDKDEVNNAIKRKGIFTLQDNNSSYNAPPLSNFQRNNKYNVFLPSSSTFSQSMSILTEYGKYKRPNGGGNPRAFNCFAGPNPGSSKNGENHDLNYEKDICNEESHDEPYVYSPRNNPENENSVREPYKSVKLGTNNNKDGESIPVNLYLERNIYYLHPRPHHFKQYHNVPDTGKNNPGIENPSNYRPDAIPAYRRSLIPDALPLFKRNKAKVRKYKKLYNSNPSLTKEFGRSIKHIRDNTKLNSNNENNNGVSLSLYHVKRQLAALAKKNNNKHGKSPKANNNNYNNHISGKNYGSNYSASSANTVANSGFTLKGQQQQHHNAILKLQHDLSQNQTSPQNLNSPIIEVQNQNLYSHDKATQSPYLFQNSQNLDQVQVKSSIYPLNQYLYSGLQNQSIYLRKRNHNLRSIFSQGQNQGQYYGFDLQNVYPYTNVYPQIHHIYSYPHSQNTLDWSVDSSDQKILQNIKIKTKVEHKQNIKSNIQYPKMNYPVSQNQGTPNLVLREAVSKNENQVTYVPNEHNQYLIFEGGNEEDEIPNIQIPAEVETTKTKSIINPIPSFHYQPTETTRYEITSSPNEYKENNDYTYLDDIAAAQPEPEYLDYAAIPAWNEQILPPLVVTTNPPKANPPEANPSEANGTVSSNATAETTFQGFFATQDWLLENTYLAMIGHHMTAFTYFLYQLFSIISNKSPEDTRALTAGAGKVINQLVSTGKLTDMGQPSQKALQSFFLSLASWTPAGVKSQAISAMDMLKNKAATLSQDIITFMKYIENSYSIEQGEELLKTLQEVESFDHTKEDAKVVARHTIDALLRPYWSTYKPSRVKLFELINTALLKRFKYEEQPLNKSRKSVDKKVSDKQNLEQMNILRDNRRDRNITGDFNFDDIKKRIDDIDQIAIKDHNKPLDVYGFVKRAQYMPEKDERLEKKDVDKSDEKMHFQKYYFEKMKSMMNHRLEKDVRFERKYIGNYGSKEINANKQEIKQIVNNEDKMVH